MFSHDDDCMVLDQCNEVDLIVLTNWINSMLVDIKLTYYPISPTWLLLDLTMSNIMVNVLWETGTVYSWQAPGFTCGLPVVFCGIRFAYLFTFLLCFLLCLSVLHLVYNVFSDISEPIHICSFFIETTKTHQIPIDGNDGPQSQLKEHWHFLMNWTWFSPWYSGTRALGGTT